MAFFTDGETVRYEYNYGGQIKSVSGTRNNTEFPYVKTIGYDEYSQRVYIEYGSGVKSRYSYDPYRRWLTKYENLRKKQWPENDFILTTSPTSQPAKTIRNPPNLDLYQ